MTDDMSVGQSSNTYTSSTKSMDPSTANLAVWKMSM